MKKFYEEHIFYDDHRAFSSTRNVSYLFPHSLCVSTNISDPHVFVGIRLYLHPLKHFTLGLFLSLS